MSNAKGDKTSRLCQARENMLFEDSEFKSKSTCTGFKEIYSLVRLFCSWNKRKYDQWWEVKFVGEGIIDQVGWYGTDHWDS